MQIRILNISGLESDSYLSANKSNSITSGEIKATQNNNLLYLEQVPKLMLVNKLSKAYFLNSAGSLFLSMKLGQSKS